EDRHDVAGSITPVGVVAEYRCLDRLAAVVVKPALRHMLAEAYPEEAAEQAQRHHYADHDEPVAIYSSTPPGEHVSSLLDLRRPAHWFSCQTREVSNEDSGRNGCSHAPLSGSESRPIRGSGSRNTPAMSSRSTNSKVSDANAQLACSRNPSTWTGTPLCEISSRGSRNAWPSADATTSAAKPSCERCAMCSSMSLSTSLSSSTLGLAKTANPTLRS